MRKGAAKSVRRFEDNQSGRRSRTAHVSITAQTLKCFKNREIGTAAADCRSPFHTPGCDRDAPQPCSGS